MRECPVGWACLNVIESGAVERGEAGEGGLQTLAAVRSPSGTALSRSCEGGYLTFQKKHWRARLAHEVRRGLAISQKGTRNDLFF